MLQERGYNASTKPSKFEERAVLPPEEVDVMGIGVSLFLMALGAILAWAVSVEVSGVNLDTIGVILMIIGALGLVMSMLFWSSFAPFRRDERTVVRDREVL